MTSRCTGPGEVCRIRWILAIVGFFFDPYFGPVVGYLIGYYLDSTRMVPQASHPVGPMLSSPADGERMTFGEPMAPQALLDAIVAHDQRPDQARALESTLFQRGHDFGAQLPYLVMALTSLLTRSYAIHGGSHAARQRMSLPRWEQRVQGAVTRGSMAMDEVLRTQPDITIAELDIALFSLLQQCAEKSTARFSDVPMDQILQFDDAFKARFPQAVTAVGDLRAIFSDMGMDAAGAAIRLFADTYHLYVWQRLHAWHGDAVGERVVRLQRIMIQILNKARLPLCDAIVVLSVLLEQTAMFAARSEQAGAAQGRGAAGAGASRSAPRRLAEKDYYQVLEVHPQAGQELIDQARRNLAKKYHPDRNPQQKEWANAKMAAINEAHQVLSDAQQRAAYDRQARPSPPS